MRAKEIINEKEIKYIDPKINSILVKKGYRKLGKGLDQVAYSSPDGQVLKIFKTNQHMAQGEFSGSQRMVIEWIRYCQANKNNPFLPKFSGSESFEFPEGSGQMYLQIKMEKLGKFPMSWHKELAEMAGAISSGTTLNEYMEGRFPKTIYSADERTITLVMHLGQPDLKKLWTTMEKLNEICEKNQWGWDLHSGNFMIRSDGTPVIVDPYFLGSK